MLIFEQDPQISTIYHRALSLMIDMQFAGLKTGKVIIKDPKLSEQENRRRELLAVEEESHKNKAIAADDKKQYQATIQANFFKQTSAKVHRTFDNKNYVENILHIESASPDILDILSVRAASINRITPLVNVLPWLKHEVINLVNKPQYRKSSDVKVNKLNLALSYVGLDNLKLVMPTFMLKHWLPTNTAPFPLMKRKLWKHSLSVGLSAKLLAKQHGIDEFTAFCAGMLSNLGLLSITKGFLQHYSEIHEQALINAYNKKDNKLHAALMAIDTPKDLLLEQLIQRNSIITADIVKSMDFERLYITNAFQELAEAKSINEMGDIAQLILKATTFVMFRSLAKDKLISADEAKTLLKAGQLNVQEIALLKKSDIDHIKLDFKQ